jgi:hypothetical protein
MKYAVLIFPMMFAVSSCAWLFPKVPVQPHTDKEVRVCEDKKRHDEPEKLITPTIPEPIRYPTAVPIPGRPGMVFSPYDNRVIDCVGLAKGTLVYDPRYPADKKKCFVVP